MLKGMLGKVTVIRRHGPQQASGGFPALRVFSEQIRKVKFCCGRGGIEQIKKKDHWLLSWKDKFLAVRVGGIFLFQPVLLCVSTRSAC